MELTLMQSALMYLGIAFALGLIVGSGLFCFGLLVGRLQSQGGIGSLFTKEQVIPLEDVPGTEEYYDKARLAPEDGGHKDPFESELIDLNRHSNQE